MTLMTMTMTMENMTTRLNDKVYGDVRKRLDEGMIVHAEVSFWNVWNLSFELVSATRDPLKRWIVVFWWARKKSILSRLLCGTKSCAELNLVGTSNKGKHCKTLTHLNSLLDNSVYDLWRINWEYYNVHWQHKSIDEVLNTFGVGAQFNANRDGFHFIRNR